MSLVHYRRTMGGPDFPLSINVAQTNPWKVKSASDGLKIKLDE